MLGKSTPGRSFSWSSLKTAVANFLPPSSPPRLKLSVMTGSEYACSEQSPPELSNAGNFIASVDAEPTLCWKQWLGRYRRGKEVAQDDSAADDKGPCRGSWRRWLDRCRPGKTAEEPGIFIVEETMIVFELDQGYWSDREGGWADPMPNIRVVALGE